MSEGRYWNCRWESLPTGFRAWVASRPKIEATGKTWQDTLDELCGEICSASGDGEPNLRFDPPEPVDGGGDAKWYHPTWSILSIQGFVPLADMHDDLFTGGFCKACRTPQGERTDTPLQATGPGEGDLCGTWGVAAFHPVMLSQRSLELWQPGELDGFRLQPVVRAPRCRIQYFECIPLSYVVPAAIRGWTIEGRRCTACSKASFTCTSDQEVHFQPGQNHDWCSAADLTDPPRILAHGTPKWWHFLISTKRARAICRHRFSRGGRVLPIGVVPENMVIREPRLLPESPPFKQPFMPAPPRMIAEDN